MFKAFKGLSDFVGKFWTVGGLILLPFIGSIANRVKLQNPDAGLGEMLGGFWAPLVTDPENVVVPPDPSVAVDAGAVATGFDGVIEGVSGIFDGWGHIFSAAWDLIPMAATASADVATGGLATGITAAFNAVSGGLSIADPRGLIPGMP
ncbi:MAG: hypothetical protein GC137_04945 [Alphaproteobacteria bacterium]|nr:hypothetical protein [Alphaproteobacteria bacterium]